MEMKDIRTIKYSTADILTRREEIGTRLLGSSAHLISADIRRIAPSDLELMYQLYDQIFFDNWLRQNFAGKLQFSISRQMTKSAGKTICSKNNPPDARVIEIRISLPIIANYGAVEGLDLVGGVKCYSRLDALQLIFEHELVHVLEFVLFGNSSCKQNRYQNIAANLFGHQSSYHQLPTHREITRRELGLEPGTEVTFQYDGASMRGIIQSIRKRAAVMVVDSKGPYHDRYGKRYSKYLVPLQLLRRLD